jgi:hypothetical protein
MSTSSSKHICRHCGAVYQVGETRRCRRPSYHTAVCSFCGDMMAEWRGCARHYHRVKRPRPLVQARKIVAEVASGRARSGKARGRAASLGAYRRVVRRRSQVNRA